LDALGFSEGSVERRIVVRVDGRCGACPEKPPTEASIGENKVIAFAHPREAIAFAVLWKPREPILADKFRGVQVGEANVAAKLVTDLEILLVVVDPQTRDFGRNRTPDRPR
jgi:hypothetical protein